MSSSSLFAGVRAVLLDIDDTLLDFRSCAGIALDTAFRNAGVVYRDEYYPTFQKINSSLWRQLEEQRITREELHACRFRLVFEALGLSGDFPKAEASFFTALKAAAVPMVGARELLSALKAAGYRTVCASNASHSEQGRRLEKAGLLEFIDDIVVSSDVGVAKPAPEFFNLCVARAGVTADECVMVGDNLFADVAGAMNVGIRGIYLNLTGAPLSEGITPTATVSTLAEVEALLLPKKG